MKLTACKIPYDRSGSGAISLLDEKGFCQFWLELHGVTEKVSDQITEQLAAMIRQHGIEVAE